jgi:hypothetical protein
MPGAKCLAKGCVLRTGTVETKGVSFFQFPNPKTRRDLAQRWIENCGIKCDIDKFTLGTNGLICEKHFTIDCFTEDNHIKINKALGKRPRYEKVLKIDAVPTIFANEWQNTNEVLWSCILYY